MTVVPADSGAEDVGVPPFRRPQMTVFDVNETLPDMTSISDRFADVGAPTQMSSLWFASLLRDGFALSKAGTAATFTGLDLWLWVTSDAISSAGRNRRTQTSKQSR